RRFAFLMAVVFLDERPNTQEWIGLGLVTAGVLTLALKR
ncbi:eamA-like transporter family protein, partial [Neisseria meningitidis]